MATYKCENCGREAEWLDGQKDIYCAMCGYGKLLPLITQTEPVAKVPCSDRVMPRCFLCESLKLESRTPLMKATKGVYVCHCCVDTLYEVMTAEKKGETLKLPKGA